MTRVQKLTALSVVWLVVAAVLHSSYAFAVMDPRFELDPRAIVVPKEGDTQKKVVKQPPSRSVRKKEELSPAKGGTYTVKSLEQLQRMLGRNFELNDSEMGPFLEEIRQENNLLDVKRLKVGQKIVIPPVRRRPDGALILRGMTPVGGGLASSLDGSTPRQSFTLESPVKQLTEQEIIGKALNVWKNIIPPQKEQLKPLSVQNSSFSLTLDTAQYPTFARMDGGRMVLDRNGTIPPLVKSLIEAKDPSVRILTEPPSGSKRFMASLLEAAGFYSVEENFSMQFGVDPKLTVQADFKIEKMADSLVKQDVLLVNSGRVAFPTSVGDILRKEGFTLQEPFASLKPLSHHDSRTIHTVAVKQQSQMVDDILSAFSITSEPHRTVEVFASEHNGISLSVKSERYFERGGKKYIVTSFDGDPINYTLFRILETKGYNVVILEAQDNFRKISEKLISRMKIAGNYGFHDLLKDNSSGYTLQMSGFKLDDRLLPGGGIFLTDRPMDRVIRDLCTENGYNITNR